MLNTRNIVAAYETFDAFKHDILVILVVYGASATRIADRFRAQLPGVHLFVYDNNPNARGEPHDSYAYEHDATNGGVSKAYNRGFDYARSNGIGWLLLADQDSDLNETYLLAAWKRIQTTSAVVLVPKMLDKYGIASPFQWFPPKGRRLKELATAYDFNNYRFINSGLLIEVKVFAKAGGYDEQFPLDYADIDFGESVSQVAKVFHVVDLTIRHQMDCESKLSRDRAIARFHFFRVGALRMGDKHHQKLRYRSYCVARAIKLCWQYRTFDFLKIALTDG